MLDVVDTAIAAEALAADGLLGLPVDARKMNNKFATDGNSFTYEYGDMEVYHGGLEGLIGNPDPRVADQLCWEHTESPYSNKEFWCWWKGNTSGW